MLTIKEKPTLFCKKSNFSRVLVQVDIIVCSCFFAVKSHLVELVYGARNFLIFKIQEKLGIRNRAFYFSKYRKKYKFVYKLRSSFCKLHKVLFAFKKSMISEELR